MESLKEYLLSKYFSSFGFVVAALHIPALVTFAAVAGQLRTSERRTFRCDATDCRHDCLREYDERFNSPFPLYAFVLLCFVPSLAVCITYSWCFVKSRVDDIEAAMKPDPENPCRRPRVKTRRVFCYYFLHLLIRFVLGISMTVLQCLAFYPTGFPAEFVCLVCDAPGMRRTKNSTNFNTTEMVDAFAINCDNSVGSDNATWAKAISIVNSLFGFLVFAEICYLLARVLKCNSFTFDSEFCLQHFFNKRGTPVTLRDSTYRLKVRFRKDTEYLEPLISSGSENKDKRALDNVFVDLVIYTGRAEHKMISYSSERHEIYDMYLKPLQESVALKKLEELFLPNRDTPDPRKILIVGRPGIGKSLLCTKLLRDWSQDKILCDNGKNFKHFFLFQFRWFNHDDQSCGTAVEKISLKQLLSRVCPEKQIDNDMFQDILDNPKRVLLIFDGLDEFKHHDSCLEDEHAQAGNCPTEEMQFSALYVKLMKGKQLSGATVLTTSRPNVVQSVAGLTFDRTVEIMGFTPEKVLEYVSKFCAHNTETMNKLWIHISNNLELLSLCYIPVNSFIVCSLLEKWITIDEQDSAESTLPKTSTEVYEGALRLFIFKHHPEFKGKTLTKDYLMGNVGFSDSIEETLDQLGSLAKTGIEAGQLIFGSTEVQGMENCGLLNRLPDSEVSPYRFTSHFCFTHLTLQELLAAREIVKMEPIDLSNFISTNASDPKWHLVIQFVAGLLRGQENEAVNSFVSHLHNCLITNRERPRLKEPKQETLLMLKCLYEYNNEIIAKKAASELHENIKFSNEIDLSSVRVTPVECAAIAYFVKHLTEPTVLNLYGNSITDQGVSHLYGALKDANCGVTVLNLKANSITDQGISHLCGALKDVNCRLTELNLGINNITDQGVLLLCDTVNDVNCKLKKLELHGNSITDQSVLTRLFDALKGINCKLTEFNPPGDEITEQSVSHLCGVLKDLNCKLTKLDLHCSSITDQRVLSHVYDALKDENCKLIELNLSDNSVTDQGVSHLCDALKDENCKLTELNLGYNCITDRGVSYLCDALKDINSELVGLNLKFNGITDQGVSHLCDALNNINCKLAKLDLSYNSITDKGVLQLCDALKHINCKLTEVNLSCNKITCQGKMQLLRAQGDKLVVITEW